MDDIQRDAAPALTVGKTKLRSLELGRFIAASMVVFAHLTVAVDNYATRSGQLIFGGVGRGGALGVAFFFVLSGFVMVSAHYDDFGKRGAVLNFWWRRICRIYPAYWLALVIPIYYARVAFTPGFGAQLFTLSPWFSSDLNTAAWTLRYEVAFYIMFGIALLPRVGKPIFVLWIGLCFWHILQSREMGALRMPTHVPYPWLMAHGGGHFFSVFEYFFIAGAAAGFVFVRFAPGWRVSAALLGGGALMLLLCLPQIDWGSGYGAPHSRVLEYLGWILAAILLGLAGLERSGRLRLGRVSARLGVLSYPLYILHTCLITWVWFALPHPGLSLVEQYLAFCVMMVFIYGVCALAAFYFDQPIQRALRRVGFTRRRSVVSV